MQLKQLEFITLAICLSAIWSCTTTKYVPNGQYLLDKVRIKTDTTDIKPSELKNYLQQQPNFKVFGIFKWPLYLYSLSGRKEERFINRQLRKMGEPPVLFDFIQAELSREQLQRHLANKGYLNAKITMSIDTTRHKKAVVDYTVTSNIPYRITKYTSSVSDSLIDVIIHQPPPPRSLLSSVFRAHPKEYISLIKEGILFDRILLDRERQRLTTLLRNNGYYALNRDYIGFLADSALNNNSVSLALRIKPPVNTDSSAIHSQPQHKRYYINNVSIFTDYEPLEKTSSGSNFTVIDSAQTRGIHIYYGTGGRIVRPEVLQQSCYIVPETLYNEKNVEQTYSSYASLKALRYMSIKFEELQTGDSMKLNCIVLTAQAKRQGVQYDVEGTNSAGDIGFASSLTYQHRNLFRGSELFSAKVRGGYEYLSSTQERGNYWELAGETSIHFPHFMFPFISYDFRRRIRATTEFKLSYDQQRRPEYYRSIVSGGWSYHWQNRLNTLARHTFNLLDINYVFLPFIERDFKDMLSETTALYNYSDRFVVSSGYVYSFNNYDPIERRSNTYSFRVGIETAGNLTYALTKLLNSKKDSNGRYKLFGINYSEFVKGDVDIARSITLDTRNAVAFHFGAGLAYPYGNSREIPFERRYYSGGANSNRGWSVRTLGPGSMTVTDSTSFINQTGDIRLDASIEYRSRLFWKLELALFADAGNIWTIHKYDYQPDGVFELNRFYREIALSYGLGIRIDFDYFLIRLDAGLKAYNPQTKDKWALYNPNLHDNFAWHFAVGYPF